MMTRCGAKNCVVSKTTT